MGQTTASSEVESICCGSSGPRSSYDSWPDATPLATCTSPLKLPRSPLMAVIQPEVVILQVPELAGGIQNLVASADGSGGIAVRSCTPLPFVSAKALIVSVPGSVAV